MPRECLLGPATHAQLAESPQQTLMLGPGKELPALYLTLPPVSLLQLRTLWDPLY